jgi:hypothetical protein
LDTPARPDLRDREAVLLPPDDRAAGEAFSVADRRRLSGRLGRQASLVLAPTAAVVAVGAAADGAWFWVAYAAAVGVLLGVVFALRREPVLVAASFLLWLSIQRFVIATLSPSLDASELRGLLGYKELFFPVLGVVLAPRLLPELRRGRGAVRTADLLALGFGALILVALVVSPAPLDDRLIYARRLAVLPFVYVVARLLPWRGRDVRSLGAMAVVAAVALTAFGLIERFVAEEPIWRDLVPAAYYYHVSGLADLNTPGTDFPVEGLPRVFFDWSGGSPVRRLVSTFLEATTLASFLAAAVVLSLTYRPVVSLGVAAAAFVGVGTLLTLSKGGLGIMVIGLGYLVATATLPRLRDPAWIWSIGAGLLGALLIVALALERSGTATGALAHFDGLKEGVVSALSAPLGVGLGVAGGFGFGSSTTGAESTFGVLLVQVGVPGLAVWVAWLIVVAYACASLRDRVPGSPVLGPGVAGLLVAFLATASLTESAGGLLGNWIYPFVAGAVITVAQRADPPA